MLKPKHVSTYTGAINQVVSDFILKIDWLRQTHGDGTIVHDMAGELYKFAFEGKEMREFVVICRWELHRRISTVV